MKKKWILTNDMIDGEIKGLSPVLLKILNKRGLVEESEIKSFLYGSLDDLHNPFLLSDMEKAVSRIIDAVNNEEKITVFGDYDVDGITSTALLFRYFKETFDYNLDFYLPNRQKEGYGLNKGAIKGFSEKGYDLMITVDCGITAIDEVEYANRKNIDVIITDHHQAGDKLPEAIAVVDPHRNDDSYPFKYLAGVGVAFKLCQALEYKMTGNYVSERIIQLLDIVTLGTVADIVSLTGENRILVKKGLERVNDTNNIGLKELISKVGLTEKKITTGHIGYIIAPHLNAAGRVSDPLNCVELLKTENKDRADNIASELKRINKERQELEQRIMYEAIDMVENQIDLDNEKAIVLASEKWHSGVIGIVASRLVEKYYRPTILISIEKGVGKGSCRSISGLNIYKVLNECSEYLEGFGGHKMAAGLTIDPDNLSNFRSCFNSTLDLRLNKEDLVPKLKADALLDAEEITMDFYEQLNLLEPFGMGNSRPTFILANMKVSNSYPVGKDKKHLKFSLDNGLDGIGFGFGEEINKFKNNTIDMAIHLDLNEWQGKTNIQLCLEDFNLRKQCGYFPVYFKSDGYTIADKRGCFDLANYIKQILYSYSKRKIVVYINDIKIYRTINKKISNENVFIFDNMEVLNEFNDVDRGALFYTTSMLKNFNETEIKELDEIKVNDIIFFSMPFSINEIRHSTSFFSSRNSLKPVIHLLYSKKHLEINKQLIKKSLPSKKYLRQLYLYLKALSSNEIFIDNLKKVINEDGRLYFNQLIINKSMQILQEVGLVELNGSRIDLLPAPVERLDLSSSISYNDTIDVINKFKKLVDLTLTGDLFLLIEELNKPYEEAK